MDKRIFIRYQTVETQRIQSEKLEVTSGVPQGSVLGPVLFLCFKNYLAQDLKCPALVLADDLKFFKLNIYDIRAKKLNLIRLQDWKKK